MQVFSPTFTHFLVESCRDRRLRAFSKILARSLFSFPCLSQILSSTPGVFKGVVLLCNHVFEGYVLISLSRCQWDTCAFFLSRKTDDVAYMGCLGLAWTLTLLSQLGFDSAMHLNEK